MTTATQPPQPCRLGGLTTSQVVVLAFAAITIASSVVLTLITNTPGEWRWVYAEGGWEGHLHFKNEGGKLTFTGDEFKWVDGKQEPLFDLENGTATLLGGNTLQLAADVVDHGDNKHFHWVSTGPFQLVPAFRGELRTQPDNNSRWGMMIYKWPASTQ